MKKGEKPLAGSKRELKEETGLSGENWNAIGKIKENLAVYSCAASGHGKITAGEIKDAKWFSAPPLSLSFSRDEAFELLRRAGKSAKGKVNYDVASEYFDNVRRSIPEILESWTENLIKWGEIDAPSKVLDIGCGTGIYSLEIMKRTGAEVVGLDSSKGMLSRAREKSPGFWIHADAVGIPVSDEKYDTAILMLVLQHVDDEPLAISEAYRVLKPGGKLVIVTASHGRIRRHMMRHFPGMVSLDLKRFLPIPELKWHMQDAGFTDIHSHRTKNAPQVQTVEEIIDRFRKRYISTLVLLSQEDFEKGLVIFERRLRKLYGNEVENIIDLTFVEARKP